VSPNQPDKHSDEIPPALRQRYEAVVRLADTVCREHLNDEYAELAQKMAADLCRFEPSLLERGRSESWACGIVYALGKVNFLFDKSQTPHLSSGELCKLFGVSPATGSSKARAILDQLDSFQLDPRWCLPSMLETNPLAWIVEIDGSPVDVRWLPLEVQEELARLRIIPYVPEPDTEGP
jgi:hypothetical protein